MRYSNSHDRSYRETRRGNGHLSRSKSLTNLQTDDQRPATIPSKASLLYTETLPSIQTKALEDQKDTQRFDKMDVLEDEGFKEPPKVTTVPWLRQLFCVLCKNVLLLSRRPFYITFMCLSSVVSVLLAFPIVHRHEKPIDFGTVPLTACGTVVQHFVDSTTNYLDIPLTYNEPWRNGLAVIVMGKLITVSHSK